MSLSRPPWADALDRPGRIETFLAFVCLLLFAEALLGRVLGEDPLNDTGNGAPILRFVWLPAYAFAIAGLALAWRRIGDAFFAAPLLFVFVLWAALSTNWSIAPDATSRRAIALFATVGFGVYLALRYDWLTILRLLGAAWLVLGVGSLVSAIASPAFGIMSEIHPGAWRGLWWEKNTLGGHYARSAFLFACLVIADRKLRPVWIVSVVLSVFLVLMSTSKTSLLGMLLGFGAIAVWLIAQRGPGVLALMTWGATVSAGAIAFVVVFMPEAVFAVLGRDATLTGRTDIWIALFRQLEATPWLGFGYGAFWLDDSAPAFWLRQETEWPVPTAHNGWFEIALWCGWTGVAIFVADYVRALARSLRKAGGVYGLFALGWLAQMIVFSVSESVFMLQNNILTATYALIAVKIALGKERARAPLAASPPPPRFVLPTRIVSADRGAVELRAEGRKPEHLAEPLRRPVEPVRAVRRSA